jgi:branched-chain amino acid transport system substrate-binding protein
MRTRIYVALAASLAFVALDTGSVSAQSKYDVGADDHEIKIGNILAYSGPVSSLGVIGKVEAAYFKKINDEGGITTARSIHLLRRRHSPEDRRASAQTRGK